MIRSSAALVAAFLPCALTSAEVIFFNDANAFGINNQIHGKMSKGVEDFEEGTVVGGDKVPFPNPLSHWVSRIPFPNGINATNLVIQTNITPTACPPAPNPSTNPAALFAVGPDFHGSNSIKVGEDEFLSGVVASLDLIFTDDNKTAVSFQLARFDSFSRAGWIVCVYDLAGAVIGNLTVAGPEPTEPDKVFFGVWSSVPIGRINIFDNSQFPSPDAVDNIEMFYSNIPSPGSMALLGLGAVVALRRRR